MGEGVMKRLQLPFNVRVTSTGSDNRTQTVDGQRAASTCSPQVAMERLVDKLAALRAMRPGVLRCREVPGLRVGHTQSVWQLYEHLEGN